MDGTIEKQPCVYLLANKNNGALYTGVTSNLLEKVWELKHKSITNHNRYALVWFEKHESMQTAIERKQAIKSWQRVWKIKTIEVKNPHWRDLYQDLI
jgi:putative endonuclease